METRCRLESSWIEKSTAIFQLLACRDECPLGGVGGALVILDLALTFSGLYLQGLGLHKDSHLNLLTKGLKYKVQSTSEPLLWTSSTKFLNDFGPVSCGRWEGVSGSTFYQPRSLAGLE